MNIYEIPGVMYVFKINYENTRTVCEICLKIIKKTPKQRHWGCSGVFMVNFVQILHTVLVIL